MNRLIPIVIILSIGYLAGAKFPVLAAKLGVV